MRLLYLTDRLSGRGGADHHLAQVVFASVDAGHQPTVAYGREDGTATAQDGVEYRRVRGLSSMVQSSSRLGDLERMLAEADVVHIQNVMNPTPLTMAVECGRAVVTIQDHRVFCPAQGKTMPDGSVCTVPMSDSACHTCIPDSAYRRSTLELTRRRSAAVRGAEILVLSTYMEKELSAVGLGGSKVLPPWVDIGPATTDRGSTFVLGGRLVAHKAILDGWRAWKTAGRQLPLVVAGAGPLGAELVGAEMRGWLGQRDLRAALRRARALIFPARWQEPFGILGLESLAQGTPVIVAESGGTIEWSTSGCIRVPAGDIGAMAAAIARLTDDPELALHLGRAGQAAVAERFSRAAILPRLLEVYSKVAAS